MKKYAIGIWLTLISAFILAGCLTEDFNLRTIKDSRNYATEDSINNGMHWLTESWVNSHAQQWASAGLIIARAENVFPLDRKGSRWIGDIVDAGFKGKIVIELDVDNLYNSWGTSSAGYENPILFQRDWYYSFINSSIIARTAEDRWLHTQDPTSYYVPADLTISQTFIDNAGSLVANYVDTLISIYSIDTDDVSFSVYFDGYDQTSWKPYTDDSATMETLTADPLALGKSIETYTPVEMESFDLYYDAWIDAFNNAGLDVVLGGGRFLSEYVGTGNLDNSKFADYSCIGFFFEDVDVANVDSVILDVATYRSSFTPATADSALLMIAGIKNNVYNTFDVVLGDDGTYPNNYSAYADLINKLIAAGMYFTPGGEGNYWDFPQSQPGNWWIRIEDDAQWQNNPNNPTYASITVGPRQLFNIPDPGDPDVIVDPGDPVDPPPAETDYTLQVSPSFPGGGWLHAGAILHDNSLVIVGADVSGVYASSDGGQTFDLWNYGIANNDEIKNYYVNDIEAIKNEYFEGALCATFGGIYKMETADLISAKGLNPWESITPITDGMYTSNVEVAWVDPDGWLAPHGWSDISWDNDKFVVMCPGKYRWERSNTDYQYQAGAYPEGTFDVTRYSLFKMQYDDTAESEHIIPWAPYDADAGAIIDISVVTTSALDTLALCATNYEGPALWDNSKWTDLGLGATWYNYDGTTSTPIWNTDGIMGSTSARAVGDIDETNGMRVVSVFLTDAKIGYVALTHSSRNATMSSGVYRCADVTAVSPEWRYVADGTTFNFWYTDNKTMAQQSVGQGSSYPDPGWTYLSGHQANKTTQDTLFVADRVSRLGFARILIDNSGGVGQPWEATWEPLIWLYGNATDTAQPQGISDFHYSVPSEWGMQGIFEMMIDPDNAMRTTAHPNARIFNTTDNWATYYDGFVESKVDDETWFKGTGYDETCLNGVQIGTDGRLYYSVGDVGIHVTDYTDWEYLHKFHPSDSFENCDDYEAGDWSGTGRPLTTTWTDAESGGVMLLRDFNGTGRDGLFITGGDVIQRNSFNKMWFYHDSDGDGTMENYEISDVIPDIDRFKFNSMRPAWDPINEIAYWAYTKYNMSLCQDSYEYTLGTALTTNGITSVVVAEDIEEVVDAVGGTTLPQQGTLYVYDDSGTRRKLHYSAWGSSTFTIDGAETGDDDFLGNEATAGVRVYIPEEQIQRVGVFAGTWTGSDWSIATLDTASLPDDATQGYESLTLIDGRLFMGLRGNTGGIWYNDAPGGGTDTWVQCYGPASGEHDVNSMDSDGNHLWFVARGGAGHNSGLFQIANPLTAPTVYERLCNDGAGDVNQVPIPLADITSANTILWDRYGSAYDANEHLFDPGVVMVDPFDTESCYFWLSGNDNNLTEVGGVWRYDGNIDDGSTYSFQHLFPNDVSNSLGPNRGTVDYTSRTFDVPRVVYGTHCSGIRWFNLTPPDTNLIYESQDFTLTGWSGETNFTMTSATDPLGGSVATQFEINGGTPNNANLISTNMPVLGSETLVASVYAKAGVNAVRDLQRLGLYDSTDATLRAYLNMDFSSGTPTHSSSAGIYDYGFEDAGNGWWRCWIAFDRGVVTNYQNSYNVRWQISDATPDIGGQIMLWGFQLEINVSSPGNYVYMTAGAEEGSQPPPPPTPPTAPTNLAVVQVIGGDLSLDWDDHGDAVTYNLYRGSTIGSMGLNTTGIVGSAYLDESVVDGTRYFYAVTVVDAQPEESSQSNIVTEVSDSSGPSVNFVSISRGVGYVNIDWSDPEDTDLDYYKLERNVDNAGYVAFQTLPNGHISFYNDTDVIDSYTYGYRLVAVDSLGHEVAGGEAGIAPDITSPSVVTGLLASEVAGTISLDWNDSTENDFDVYIVYRWVDIEDLSILDGAVETSNYDDDTGESGVEYFYAVAAADSTGNISNQSDIVSETPRDIPAITVVSSNYNWGLELASVDVTADQLIYIAYRHQVDGGAFTTLVTADTLATSGTIYFDTQSETDGATITTEISGENFSEVAATPVTEDVVIVRSAPPVADFQSDVITQGLDQGVATVVFEDLSTNSPTTWNWSYGDSTARGTIENPSHDYTAVGNYTVTLWAVNINGGDDETKVDYIEITADVTAPGQPTGESANGGDGTITLDWDDNTETDLSHYTIYRRNFDGSLALFDDDILTSTYVDNTVPNDSTYFYTIGAVDNDDNESIDSSEVSATASVGGTTVYYVFSRDATDYTLDGTNLTIDSTDYFDGDAVYTWDDADLRLLQGMLDPSDSSTPLPGLGYLPLEDISGLPLATDQSPGRTGLLYFDVSDTLAARTETMPVDAVYLHISTQAAETAGTGGYIRAISITDGSLDSWFTADDHSDRYADVCYDYYNGTSSWSPAINTYGVADIGANYDDFTGTSTANSRFVLSGFENDVQDWIDGTSDEGGFFIYGVDGTGGTLGAFNINSWLSTPSTERPVLVIKVVR